MTGPIRDVESAVRELGALPMPAGPALTVEELLAENALLKRKVASLKEQQEKDDAEYAEVIADRDRAQRRLAVADRLSLPEKLKVDTIAPEYRNGYVHALADMREAWLALHMEGGAPR